jgi:hypothetical protein
VGVLNTDAHVNCNTGDIATGGGVYVTTPGTNNTEVQRSAPVTGDTNVPAATGTPNGWMGHADVAFTVYVVCLDV